MGSFLFLVGFLGLAGFIVKLIMDTIKRKPKKLDLIGIAVCFILFITGATMDTDNAKKTNKDISTLKEESVKGDKLEKEKEKVDLDVTGDLSVKVSDNKIIASVTTNAIDGSMFEISITDANLNMVSDIVGTEKGKAVKEFEVDDKWEVGYLAGTASMRFNLNDHSQPKQVKEAYGENGEKIKGNLAEKNNKNGNNVVLKTKTIPYPDVETANAKQEEVFEENKQELINLSNGVVINIEQRPGAEDWSLVSVVVSDAWYNSQEHEKERFAEQMSDTVKALLEGGGKIEKGESIMVYIVDAYGKDLATPKVLGGYKIKR